MKVSILMAVYNAEKWVRKAIDSVLVQSYHDWELICMDDGSIDNSIQILQQYVKQDSRIHSYLYTHCGSHAALLNRGAKLAKGDFLFQLDSDDYLSPDVLAQLVQRQSETKADIVLPDLYRISETGQKVSCIEGCLGNHQKIITGRQAVVYSLDWSIHTIGLVRKDIAIAYPFEENGYCVEVTSRQRLFASQKVAFSEGVYYYLQNTQSITHRFGVRRFYYVVIDMKIMHFLHKNGFLQEVEIAYYAASLKRLIAAQMLYFQRKRELSIEDTVKVEEYLEEAYRYAMSRMDLFEKTKQFLSPKQYMVFRVRQQWVFKLYCYLKK